MAKAVTLGSGPMNVAKLANKAVVLRGPGGTQSGKTNALPSRVK